MNIKDAKEQIRKAMVAYFTKDEHGNYRIPPERQRPVFLMGPPGVGKTAIVEQVARELGVGFVSYSMTHHTRQSALGLPFITTKVYGGKEYSVSEYTMSEIIASVYDAIEESGCEEGILFLDEINCVSETLAPAMLQFLQYKVFGRHTVPEGWIVVTAGNPPEYNNSVRDFDIATWDRLKRVDIEPDYDIWKEYAYSTGVHASILSYLDSKPQSFYKIHNTEDGMKFVTARGWDDLSQMIHLYEDNDLAVDKDLIAQYIQDDAIATEFSVYYELYKKYESDYQIDKIMKGETGDDVVERVKNAEFDERLSVLSALIDDISGHVKEVTDEENRLSGLLSELKALAGKLSQKDLTPAEAMDKEIISLQNIADKRKTLNLSAERYSALCEDIDFMIEEKEKMSSETSGQTAFKVIQHDYNLMPKKLNRDIKKAQDYLDNVFTFCEEAFGDGQEMLILVTELTVNQCTAKFINNYGCEKYYAHNQELRFDNRKSKLTRQIQDMEMQADE